MKDFHLSLDYYELLNLHKALLEAKFHMNPDNELRSEERRVGKEG